MDCCPIIFFITHLFLILHPSLFSSTLSSLLHRPARTFSISKSIFQTLQQAFHLNVFPLYIERQRERWGAAHLEDAENNLFIFKNHQPLYTQTSLPSTGSGMTCLTLTLSVSLPSFLSLCSRRWKAAEMFIGSTKCLRSIRCSSITLCIQHKFNTHTLLQNSLWVPFKVRNVCMFMCVGVYLLCFYNVQTAIILTERLSWQEV